MSKDSNNYPEEEIVRKELPEVDDKIISTPNNTMENKKIPEPTALDKEQPKETENNKPQPVDYNPEDAVTIKGETFIIKPTKIMYQRNRTAIFYKILELYPLPDILAMEKGYLDPERDGDKCLFDWLIAVFDDSKIVKKYYDSMDSEIIYRLLSIFKRLNKINEQEENLKNRQAKVTTNR